MARSVSFKYRPNKASRHPGEPEFIHRRASKVH